MTMSVSGSVGLVKAAATTLGVPLPTGFIAAIDKADQLVAAAESIGAGPNELHRVVLDALENGRDPGTDKAVGKAVILHHLANTGCGGAARQRAEHDIAEALVTYADEMLDAWADFLAPHLTALAAAAVELPESLDDVKAISSQGVVALSHWSNATEAIRYVKAATDGAMSLCAAARIAIVRDRKPLLITPADPDALDEIARTTGAHPNTWNLARAGRPLAFIDSLGMLLERLADFDGQRQAVIDAFEEQQAHPQRTALA